MTNTNTTEKNLTGYSSIDKPWLKYYSEKAEKYVVEDTMHHIEIQTVKFGFRQNW